MENSYSKQFKTWLKKWPLVEFCCFAGIWHTHIHPTLTHRHTHTDTHTHTHTYIYIYIYICVCVCLCVYACVCVCIIRVLVVTKSLCGFVLNHEGYNMKSSQELYLGIFLIFDSFHFLNCLMIVVLQKTPWNPGATVKLPRIYNCWPSGLILSLT